jgi:hypothetical protein
MASPGPLSLALLWTSPMSEEPLAENGQQRQAIKAYRSWVLQLSVKASNMGVQGDSAHPATVMVSRQDAIDTFIRLNPELEPYRGDFEKEFSDLKAFYFFPDVWEQEKPTG